MSSEEYKLDWVKVQLTRTCNLKCSFCSQADFRDNSVVNVDEFINNVLDIAKPRLLIFTGGEPITKYQELERLLIYCKNNKIETGIFTNATLIDDEIANNMKQLSVDWIRTSINGHTKEIHELSYPEGSFDKLINGIKSLQKAGIYVKLRTTVTVNNQNYIEDLIKFVIELGIKELDFRPYLELGDCNPHLNNALNKDEIIKACSRLILYKSKYKDVIDIKLLPNWFDFLYNDVLDKENNYEPEKCHCGRQYIYIDATGNYRACAGHRLILGNIKDKKVDEIWTKCPFLLDVRNYEQDEYCKLCPKNKECHKSNCHLINYEANNRFDKINPCCPIYISDKTNAENGYKIVLDEFKKYMEVSNAI
ncbi:MAG: radical SAM protein [Oscillospiraceae bacterium]|nr:radical SAM protein [Oscillospiraceae bacterium]